MMTATIKYDFTNECWVAVADWKEYLTGVSTESPGDAVANLRKQCNKHDLW